MKNPRYPSKPQRFSNNDHLDAYFKQLHDRVLDLESRVEKLENP